VKPRSFDRINRIVRVTAFALLMAGGLAAALSTPNTSQSTTFEGVNAPQKAAEAWTLEHGEALQADESAARSER
jgi:hypothetical protein